MIGKNLYLFAAAIAGVRALYLPQPSSSRSPRQLIWNVTGDPRYQKFCDVATNITGGAAIVTGHATNTSENTANITIEVHKSIAVDIHKHIPGEVDKRAPDGFQKVFASYQTTCTDWIKNGSNKQQGDGIVKWIPFPQDHILGPGFFPFLPFLVPLRDICKALHATSHTSRDHLQNSSHSMIGRSADAKSTNHSSLNSSSESRGLLSPRNPKFPLTNDEPVTSDLAPTPPKTTLLPHHTLTPRNNSRGSLLPPMKRFSTRFNGPKFRPAPTRGISSLPSLVHTMLLPTPLRSFHVQPTGAVEARTLQPRDDPIALQTIFKNCGELPDTVVADIATVCKQDNITRQTFDCLARTTIDLTSDECKLAILQFMKMDQRAGLDNLLAIKRGRDSMLEGGGNDKDPHDPEHRNDWPPHGTDAIHVNDEAIPPGSDIGIEKAATIEEAIRVFEEEKKKEKEKGKEKEESKGKGKEEGKEKEKEEGKEKEKEKEKEQGKKDEGKEKGKGEGEGKGLPPIPTQLYDLGKKPAATQHPKRKRNWG